MEYKIILLILKIFTKIVSIIEIIIKKAMETVLMNDNAITPTRA